MTNIITLLAAAGTGILLGTGLRWLIALLKGE